MASKVRAHQRGDLHEDQERSDQRLMASKVRALRSLKVLARLRPQSILQVPCR